MTATAAEPFTVERPADVSDARWEHMKLSVHKIVTGHYPWCKDHDGDPGDPNGFCQFVQLTPFGEVTLSSGTRSGMPAIWLYVDGEAVLEAVAIPTASCMAAHLETMVHRAMDAVPMVVSEDAS